MQEQIYYIHIKRFLVISNKRKDTVHEHQFVAVQINRVYNKLKPESTIISMSHLNFISVSSKKSPL